MALEPLVPTPLPAPGTENLEMPTLEEIHHVALGIRSACLDGPTLTPLQRTVLEALTESMTGVRIPAGEFEPISAADFAKGLAGRNEGFRMRMVQVMELGRMILDDPSEEVSARVIEFAVELSMPDDLIEQMREFVSSSRVLVASDIDRSTYIANLDLSGFTPLRSDDDKFHAWANTVIRPELEAKWRALGDLPKGTLGRGVFDFYQARGFYFPGEEGSAPPILAQHDWVHVLADYGSMVESELEVFAFICRASHDPQAFTLLAMVIKLFQTGELDGAAGIFEPDAGHLEAEGMPERLGDAFRRGALTTGQPEFLATDWWSLADKPLDEVREMFNVVPKAESAIAAGSVSPWEAGGISPFQDVAGRELAEAEGRVYDSFGASVA
ncbi:MAG: hypothetical protein AAF081_19130 [Actinomycetota bacterium]